MNCHDNIYEAMEYNEETAERNIVLGAEVEICGRKGIFEAIGEPKKKYPLNSRA